MAIKVIGRSSDKFEKFECVCKECEATLEVSEFTDLKIGEFGGVKGEQGDLKVYVTCPDCKNDVLCPSGQQKLYLNVLRNLKKR